jgi:hypothetical protein
MSVRHRWLASVFVVSLLLAACAEGAPAAPPDQIPAMPAAPVTVCGNNVREGAEVCDCPATATIMCAVPATVTCESLMRGTGTVYCDPRMCNYITTFCTLGMQGGAGMGGTSGSGG